MNKTITWVLLAVVVVLAGWFIFHGRTANAPDTTGTSSEQGSSTNTNTNGLPVVGTAATANDIVIDTPKTGDKISSPIKVSGKARGSWYFEASAPVMIIDTNGKVLGQGYIQATGDWMTANFVPFTGTITFTKDPASEAGAVVFLNDNPSGDPSRQKFMAVPVFFK